MAKWETAHTNLKPRVTKATKGHPMKNANARPASTSSAVSSIASSVSDISRRSALRLLGMGGLAVGGLSVLGSSLAQAQVVNPVVNPAAIPGHYKIKIGSLEVYVLFDGTLTFPAQAYGINVPLERIEKLLNANYLPVGPTITNALNGLLIKSPQGIVLVDAGAGGKGGPANGGRMVQNLAALGISPDDVNVVIMSHLHPDHIGGLFVGGAATVSSQLVFRKAEHVITKREWDTIQNPSPGSQLRPAQAKPFFDTVLRSCTNTLEGKVRFVTGGDQIIPGVEIVDAPGHTLGHIAVRISSGNEQMIHMVDTVVHHILGFQSDIRILFDEDPVGAAATRAKLFDQVATDRTLVMGYHFPWPGLAHIRKTAAGYESVPAVWDWAAQNG
jgi:glyoxylase-like metal-dependent hydrolase (beta-lactamase superfamily II)